MIKTETSERTERGSRSASRGYVAAFSPSLSLWLDPLPRRGHEHMAIDTALLDRARRGGSPVLRLYRWSPACLSFGRHEPARRRYDRERIESLGLDVVRRPTGGRAVWHDTELTYSVSGPTTALGSLQNAYRAIHELLAQALRTLGLPVLLASRPSSAPELDGGACFNSAVGGEVVVEGRKLVGSAQVRREGGMLQHGSILLDGNQNLVAHVTRGATRPGGEISAGELLGVPVSFETMARAIVSQLAQNSEPPKRFPEVDEVVAEAQFHTALYRDPAWTWSR